MHVGTAFIADSESTEAVEPGDGAFHHPPTGAESAAVRRAPPRQDRDNATRPKPIAVRLGVIASIALQGAWRTSWPPAPAPDRRQRIDHRIEVGDVVDVCRRHLRDERDAARIGDEVVLGTCLAAIGWVRSSFFPPRMARTEPLSMTVHR